MNICLLSRCFDLRALGIGGVSMGIRNELVRRGYKPKTISARGLSIYTYFFYTLCEIPFRLPKKFDVYHALTPMEAIHIPKGRGVVTFHDIAFMTDPDKMGAGLGHSKWKRLVGVTYFEFAANIAKKCSKVIAVSEKTKQDIIDYLGVPEKKVQVIKLGIRGDLAPQEKKDDTLRVGYLGALDRRKRVHSLIDAFKRSSLGELVIGGIGTDEQSLKDQANGDSRIKFLGLVDGRLPDFYNSLDVFVFPTWLESWGLPIIEAMACKKPVVVLADAKIPWEVKRRCVLVEDLNHLLSNQAYLGRLCDFVDIEGNYQWAKAHSWERCVDEYLGVYQELMS